MARGADAREDGRHRLALVERRLDQPRLAQLRAQLRGRSGGGRRRLRAHDGRALQPGPQGRDADRAGSLAAARRDQQGEGMGSASMGIPALRRETMTNVTALRKSPGSLHLELPKLPYAEDALAPIISAETLQFHHGKHHRKYIDTANQLLEKEPVEAHSLEELVRKTSGKLFNNAAQAWNHDFYWHSLSPKGGRPSAALRHQLERDFGSYEKFVDKLAAAANGQFGSGWAWLVQREGKLDVMSTAN